MVGYRTEYHPILHLRVERPLPKKLVRSQAGLVGVAYVRVTSYEMIEWDMVYETV